MSRRLEVAERYHHFGMNVVPVEGKRATGGWERWQDEPQGEATLPELDWDAHHYTGLAGIAGPVSDGLLCLDLDGAPAQATIENLLARLGLAREYPWTVKTPGKGGGWHVWLRCAGLALALGEAAEKGKFEGDYPGTDHIELRWNHHYALLPPSAHPDGGVYRYLNGEPERAPDEIEPRRILRLTAWGDGKKARPEPKPVEGDYSAYIERALADESITLAGTQEPGRNDQLYRSAFKLGTMAHAGADRLTCEAVLVAAAKRAGLPDHESARTFGSAWDDGLDCPRDMPERRCLLSPLPAQPTITPPVERSPETAFVKLSDACRIIAKYTVEPMPKGVDWPWPRVNELARPMRPGWLSYLGGYSSHGKTAAAIECAIHAGKNGYKVLFISGEMSSEEIAVRAAQRWGLSSSRLYGAKASRDDKMAADNAAAYPPHDNVEIVYTRRMVEIEQSVRFREPGLVIVDYLQFLEIGRSSRLEGTTRNSQALKDIARRYKVPVLCLSQLRRPDRTMREEAPKLDDLRDSGSIEQDGDQVIFVWREKIERDQNNRPTYIGSFIVAKARMGGLGKVAFSFDPIVQIFTADGGAA